MSLIALLKTELISLFERFGVITCGIVNRTRQNTEAGNYELCPQLCIILIQSYFFIRCKSAKVKILTIYLLKMPDQIESSASLKFVKTPLKSFLPNFTRVWYKTGKTS